MDFSVKSFYSLASRRAKPFPRSTIWNSWAPRRASFFAWEATWAKILLLYAFFGPFGGREIGEPLRIVKAWTKRLKVFFCIFFGIGLDCILRMFCLY